jgi:type IV pilus assembly protein PilN
MRWGTALGAVALFTLVLLTLTITGWVNARRDHAAIAKKRALIADRDRIRTQAEEFLNRPENRTTRDESAVLNELIERKAFSWTLVLENLEKVMPARVHLVAMNPELDEDNQLALKMSVAGDSRDRAIELARRMEDSRRFAQTNIVSEGLTQSTTGDTVRVEIAAIYIPETQSAATTPTAETKPAKETNPAPKAETPKAPKAAAKPASKPPVNKPSAAKRKQ